MSLNEFAAAACDLRDALRQRSMIPREYPPSEVRQRAEQALSSAVDRMRRALSTLMLRGTASFPEQVRIAIDRMTQIVNTPDLGDGTDFTKMHCDAGTAVRVLVKAGANVTGDHSVPTAPEPEEGPVKLPFRIVVETCEQALSRYAVLRAELFRSLVASRFLEGGPWRIQYTRDNAAGIPTRHPRVDFVFGELTGLPGQSTKRVGVFKKTETFAPFRDFCFLSRSGGRPEEGSEARFSELRLQFLLSELLYTVTALVVSLEAIESGTHELGLATDTTPLTRMATAIPGFPYWPKVVRKQAFYDRVLAKEGVLIEDARVTLRRLMDEQENRSKSPASRSSSEVEVKPHYDTELRRLLVNGTEEKRFRQPAPCQVAVLEAFEETGWPPRLDAPLQEEQIAETVRGLNRGLKRISFERDGTGEGICWRPKSARRRRKKHT